MVDPVTEDVQIRSRGVDGGYLDRGDHVDPVLDRRLDRLVDAVDSVVIAHREQLDAGVGGPSHHLAWGQRAIRVERMALEVEGGSVFGHEPGGYRCAGPDPGWAGACGSGWAGACGRISTASPSQSAAFTAAGAGSDRREKSVLPLNQWVTTSPMRFCFPVHYLSLAGFRRAARDRSKRMKTTRERAEERRLAKLELVREQVENGSLVIRTMTEEERRQYPPRPPKPRRGG